MGHTYKGNRACYPCEKSDNDKELILTKKQEMLCLWVNGH
jgi:hypothetical protein